MINLLDVVHYAIKGEIKDGVQHVMIQPKQDSTKTHTRKVRYQYFSNHSLEYVIYNGKRYQVNTVKELYL